MGNIVAELFVKMCNVQWQYAWQYLLPFGVWGFVLSKVHDIYKMLSIQPLIGEIWGLQIY